MCKTTGSFQSLSYSRTDNKVVKPFTSLTLNWVFPPLLLIEIETSLQTDLRPSAPSVTDTQVGHFPGWAAGRQTSRFSPFNESEFSFQNNLES